MKSRLLIVFFVLFFSMSVFSATQPYALRTVTVDDVSVGESPDIVLECFDVTGTELTGGDSQGVTLNFYTRNGSPVDSVNLNCSGTGTGPVFNEPGLYYADAELQCTPNCCASVAGCSDRDWFSVSRPFSGLNIDENSALAILFVCIGVLVIIKKSGEKGGK